MAKFCVGCTKVDSFQWNGKCWGCGTSYYAYICTDCPLLVNGANKKCEDCEEAFKQRKISEEIKVSPLPPPRKRTGAVRLADKFTGKIKLVRPDKFYYEKRDKRCNRVAKDKHRNIKYQFYERHDLGDMDIVPLTKQCENEPRSYER